MVDISIHVVTYNSAHFLPRCFEGILQQTGVDFSVVVFDNASSDDSVAIAMEAGVRVIEGLDNIGYAAAHNRLIAESQSTYVLTLNPDVYLLPGYLAAMKSALDLNHRLGSAAGCLLRIETIAGTPDCIDGMGLYMRKNRRQGLRGDGQPVEEKDNCPTLIFGPDGAAAFYRRAMLEDVRFQHEIFDEDFFMHKEDIDLCWRALLRGWEAAYVPDAIAHHIRHFRPGVRREVPPRMRSDALRNRYLMMIKNEIPRQFLRDIIRILIYDLATFAYVLFFERESLSAYRSAWRLRERMLEKRRMIQAQKRVDWREMCHWMK